MFFMAMDRFLRWFTTVYPTSLVAHPAWGFSVLPWPHLCLEFSGDELSLSIWEKEQNFTFLVYKERCQILFNIDLVKMWKSSIRQSWKRCRKDSWTIFSSFFFVAGDFPNQNDQSIYNSSRNQEIYGQVNFPNSQAEGVGWLVS